MEGIVDRTKGLFENKRKRRVGIATLYSTTFVSQKFCKSLHVIATYRNTRRPLDVKCGQHALTATWEKKLLITMLGTVFSTKNFDRNFLEKKKLNKFCDQSTQINWQRIYSGPEG